MPSHELALLGAPLQRRGGKFLDVVVPVANTVPDIKSYCVLVLVVPVANTVPGKTNTNSNTNTVAHTAPGASVWGLELRVSVRVVCYNELVFVLPVTHPRC